MPLKKELCRNFQRGSCRYGERCKFSHVIQQQPKPNSFGFGMQNTSNLYHSNLQQQKPNPFGFGVQNGSLGKGITDQGSQQDQFKPFQNKWTRSSSTTGNLPALRQLENHSIAGDHKCSDPNLCKREIDEDFKNERPLWKLTCYGHLRSGPCDISGDISCEELRAAAYDGAKSGLGLQTIIDRERLLLNSKMTEIESFLNKPYAASFLAAQSSGHPVASSFSPLGSTVEAWPGMRASVPPNNAFGQLNFLQNPIQSTVAAAAQAGPANVGQAAANLPLINESMEKQNVAKDASIWMKEWMIGEIPEEEPPDEFF